MYSAKNDSLGYLFCGYNKKSIYLGNQRQKKKYNISKHNIQGLPNWWSMYGNIVHLFKDTESVKR